MIECCFVDNVCLMADTSAVNGQCEKRELAYHLPINLYNRTDVHCTVQLFNYLTISVLMVIGFLCKMYAAKFPVANTVLEIYFLAFIPSLTGLHPLLIGCGRRLKGYLDGQRFLMCRHKQDALTQVHSQPHYSRLSTTTTIYSPC